MYLSLTKNPDFLLEVFLSLIYSYANASIGSLLAAFRAG